MTISLDSLSTLAAFLARRSAIIALAVFAIVGVSVLDDYGIAIDEEKQRNNGVASFNYILGDEDALPDDVNRFYGVAFEVPLIVVERFLGLEDSRDIHLSRRLITHALFLAAGFFAWLLTYRLFGSRLTATLAMLIFLLHPRLYAHSFFNSKDVPFLSAFMIALYLIHRAFRRESVWAFALCGVGVGLLANIRIMGAMLMPAVLGMLALDAFYAMKRGERGMKHIFANICAFSTISAAAFCAVSPALWRDPLGAAEALGLLSEHPNRAVTLFRCEIVQHPNIPWDYVPTWILITTPPVALILAAVGIAYLARVIPARWRDALANSTARFGLLAAACLALPAAAVIALDSNIFNGWRHVYFLYAPLCVLAAFGLRGLAALPKPGVRAGALALTAVGIAAAAIQMISLHPYQHEYFSPLVDKSALADRWEMNYWRVSHKEALDTLLKIQPSGRLALTSPGDRYMMERSMGLVPPDDRRRFSIALAFPSFHVFAGDGGDAAVWKREVYGVPVASIVDVRAESESALRAILAAASASEPLASAGGFDLYADGGALAYINEDCGESDARGRFFLSVFPADRIDLPQTARDAGREHQSLNFDFHRYGAALDGKCVIVRDLPDYPISLVETGQWLPGEGELWSARVAAAD